MAEKRETAAKRRRREEGKERNAAWRKLTEAEQLTILLRRPGNCKRQLEKLGVTNG